MEINSFLYEQLNPVDEQAERNREEAERQAELEALEPIDFPTLEKQVKEWMLVVDPGIIKLLPAVIIANQLKGHDPFWMHIIGASGGGKSEFLNALVDLPITYSISLLTPNTFLSGMPGKGDSSLLPKINGKIMIFKDWTNILSNNKEARNEIMGQLREIYDGYMRKQFGNGRVAEWRGKVGLITGVTPAVDLAQQAQTTLGERFINYRLMMPDRKETAWRALNNGNKQEEMRKNMRNAFYAYIKGLKIPEKEPELPKESQEDIIQVANFVTMARSGVIRDFSFKKEVVFVPAVEMPTRSVQCFNLLAVSFMIMNNGPLTDLDLSIIIRTALDSIPQTNYMVIKEMARGDQQTTAQIATALGYPTSPIRLYLENLALLGVCTRIKGEDSEEGGKADRWSLQEEFTGIVRRYENIKLLTQEELDKAADQVFEKSLEEIKEELDAEKSAKEEPHEIDPQSLFAS